MFARRGGACVARFDAVEAKVLHEVLSEVVSLLSDGFDRGDPVVERLFPDVYPTDPVGSADLRQYIEGDLKTSKLDQAWVVLNALPRGGGKVRLDEVQAEAWLRALTDARLALGLRLDVRDDTDLQEELDEAVLADPTSPRVEHLSVYAFLTLLQESLVEALMGHPS
jgi:hypothetical protein